MRTKAWYALAVMALTPCLGLASGYRGKFDISSEPLSVFGVLLAMLFVLLAFSAFFGALALAQGKEEASTFGAASVMFFALWVFLVMVRWVVHWVGEASPVLLIASGGLLVSCCIGAAFSAWRQVGIRRRDIKRSIVSMLDRVEALTAPDGISKAIRTQLAELLAQLRAKAIGPTKAAATLAEIERNLVRAENGRKGLNGVEQ